EEVLDLLVDGEAAGPARGGVGSTLDVAGEELGAGEEAAHPAHVAVAVAADLVVDAAQGENLAFEGFERFEDALEVQAFAFWPELPRNRPVRREHEDDALLFPPLGGEPGEAGEEGQGGAGD